jgi:hypothetical protein
LYKEENSVQKTVKKGSFTTLNSNMPNPDPDLDLLARLGLNLTFQNMLEIQDHPSVLAIQQRRRCLPAKLLVRLVLFQVIVPVGCGAEENVEDEVVGGRKVFFRGGLRAAGQGLQWGGGDR